jgi:predicted Fe-Mo cluster-binding NifX family protein
MYANIKLKANLSNKRNKIVKIATASDNGTSISQHFGRALYFVIFKAKDGKIIDQEIRSKAVHHDVDEKLKPTSIHGCHHGYGANANIKHKGMIKTISDCQVLIAGGMGWGAYESVKNNNIDVVITNVIDINKAVKLYLEGKLPNLMHRLH